MKLTVWKYPFAVRDRYDLDLPQGAQVLKIEEQHGCPRLWALVNPDAPLERRTFQVVGTGHPIELPDTTDRPKPEHVATFQSRDGALVWHVFERWEAPAARAVEVRRDRPALNAAPLPDA